MKTEKEAQVYAVFQSISRRYDRMNDIISLGMHRRWKRDLVAAVTAQSPKRVLDVCCGTGDISFLIAEENPAAEVVGLDFSEEMLRVARARQAQRPHPNLRFVQGSAMSLPFAEGSFDCAVISFGLRNLEDYAGAVGELLRVVRPGGGVWCLDSFFPQNRSIRPFYRLYFKHIVGLLGALAAHNRAEYRWLYDSTERFLSPQELLGLFEACGLRHAAYKSYLFGAAACHSGQK